MSRGLWEICSREAENDAADRWLMLTGGEKHILTCDASSFIGSWRCRGCPYFPWGRAALSGLFTFVGFFFFFPNVHLRGGWGLFITEEGAD